MRHRTICHRILDQGSHRLFVLLVCKPLWWPHSLSPCPLPHTLGSKNPTGAARAFFKNWFFTCYPGQNLCFLCRISRAFRCHNCFLSYHVAHRVFSPPNVHFVPFVIYMRARFFQKLIFYRLPRPKITHFVYNFKSFPMVHLHVNLLCGAQVFFPAKWVFLVFFQKKKFEKWLSSALLFKCLSIEWMLYFSARNWGMRFKLRLYHSTQCRRDAAFHVCQQKKWKKRPMQNFVGDLFPHRRKCCGLVQEFRYWGQNPLCSRSCSVARNQRGIRLIVSGIVYSHLIPTDLWRTFKRFLKVSPRTSRVITYLRTRLFFPDCWPWSRW